MDKMNMLHHVFLTVLVFCGSTVYAAGDAAALQGTWKYRETRFTVCDYIRVNGQDSPYDCRPESSIVLEPLTYMFDFGNDGIVRLAVEMHLGCMDTALYRSGGYAVSGSTVTMNLGDGPDGTVSLGFDGTCLYARNSSAVICETVPDSQYCTIARQTHVFTRSSEPDPGGKSARAPSAVTVLPAPLGGMVAIGLPPGHGAVDMVISDMRGRVVAEYRNVRSSPVIWNARGAAPGLYAAEINENGVTTYLRIIR